MIYCRWAPTLGELEDTAENIWGTEEYEGDREEPTVFFGLYGFPDFYTLWRHRGKKYILWAGSDIRHFVDGYWLERDGVVKLDPKALALWINRNCESYVENRIEQKALEGVGINASIVPSFLGNIHDYEISYTHSDKPKVYTSVSGNDFDLYGWHKIPKLAERNPDIEFHLYGSDSYRHTLPNITSHGRVPKEQMNAEIKHMQGALRLTEFDGFSEILAKSILWGQWPLSTIRYPHILAVEELFTLKDKREPNYEGRMYYREHLNQFPWNQKR